MGTEVCDKAKVAAQFEPDAILQTVQMICRISCIPTGFMNSRDEGSYMALIPLMILDI